ncbi:MAG: hypothetical protein M9907_17425 [Burkholderiaceae bacterium]|nr:hypothetical protein [Burkholderiaceae bacterium]
MKAEGSVTPIDLSGTVVTAKIDYITIATPGKVALPLLDGKPKWAVSQHYRALTDHDASPADVEALIATFDNPEILELEVAVDFVPKHRLNEADDKATLNKLYDSLLNQLYPWAGEMMRDDVMGMFNPTTKSLRPLDLQRPDLRTQVVWGLRGFPAQVKLYIKGRDQNRELVWNEQLVRAEVRLSGEGLRAHGLNELSDLQGFEFRKRLSPYFRLLRGSRRRRLNQASEDSLTRILRGLKEKADANTWSEIGAPGFRQLRGVAPIVMKRDQRANERIGDALKRLERRYAEKAIFRRDAHTQEVADLESARVSPRWDPSPMTY